MDYSDNHHPSPAPGQNPGHGLRQPGADSDGQIPVRATTPQPARTTGWPIASTEIHPRPAQSNPHQLVLDSLLDSGWPADKIEKEWQDYYQSLDDNGKHHLWQTLHQPPTNEDPADDQQASQGGGISEFGRRLGRGWRRSWQTPPSMRHSRRQVIAYNLKTVLVAVGVGLIVYSLFQITVWNENYLQPYLRPQANAVQAPVIVTPGATLVDPAPRLYIPKLAIELNVDYEVPRRAADETFDDLNERFQSALTNAVVHYPTSSLPGQGNNVVIMGHSGGNIFSEGNRNYKFAFSRLRDLSSATGDLIVVNYQSRQYVYKVYESRVVEPHEVEVLRQAPRPNSITLITCDPPGNNVRRLVVFAQQISPTPSDQTETGQLIDLDQLAGEGAVLPGNSPSLIESWRNPNY